ALNSSAIVQLDERTPKRQRLLGKGAGAKKGYMKNLLAAPRGFCGGVNMAIESLDLAIGAFGTPIYVYHEIVHNKYVVETFRSKGAIFVELLDKVPMGSNR